MPVRKKSSDCPQLLRTGWGGVGRGAGKRKARARVLLKDRKQAKKNPSPHRGSITAGRWERKGRETLALWVELLLDLSLIPLAHLRVAFGW